jgi:drug/metabolite transporter (DMT)-like permease
VGLLLGAIAAVCIGFSDLFAARAGRTHPAITVTRTATLTSAMLTPLLLLLEPSTFTLRDSLLSAGSGALLGSGLVLLYEGYRSTPLGVIGPSSAVLVAVVPVVYGLVKRESLNLVQWVAIGIATLALGLVTYQPSSGESSNDAPSRAVKRGLLLGIFSGSLFGVGFLLVSVTSDASGLSPVMLQRASAFLCVAAMTPFDGSPFLITRGRPQRYGMAAGVAASIGLGALQIGFREGSTTAVGVAVSQSATCTVLLFVLFNRERFRWWQTVGIVCSALGVGLLAIG